MPPKTVTLPGGSKKEERLLSHAFTEVMDQLHLCVTVNVFERLASQCSTAGELELAKVCISEIVIANVLAIARDMESLVAEEKPERNHAPEQALSNVDRRACDVSDGSSHKASQLPGQSVVVGEDIATLQAAPKLGAVAVGNSLPIQEDETLKIDLITDAEDKSLLSEEHHDQRRADNPHPSDRSKLSGVAKARQIQSARCMLDAPDIGQPRPLFDDKADHDEVATKSIEPRVTVSGGTSNAGPAPAGSHSSPKSQQRCASVKRKRSQSPDAMSPTKGDKDVRSRANDAPIRSGPPVRKRGFSLTPPPILSSSKLAYAHEAPPNRSYLRPIPRRTNIWTPSLVRNTAMLFSGTQGPTRAGDAPRPTVKEKVASRTGARAPAKAVIDLTIEDSPRRDRGRFTQYGLGSVASLEQKPWREYLLGNGFRK